MKYVNQLTEDELKELFLKFVQTCYGSVDVDYYFRSTKLTHNVHLKAVCTVWLSTDARYTVSLEVAFDDYIVYSLYTSIEGDNNMELVNIFKDVYHKYMQSKFGEQYNRDYPLSDHEDKDTKNKVGNTDSNIDTINKWRQVIDSL